jgi:uncharacterized Zn finger protein
MAGERQPAAVRHAAFPPRRGGAKAASWWGRAWLRAVEEAAYDEGDQRTGWRLARAGVVGGILVEPGAIVASVALGEGESATCSVLVPVLEPAEIRGLVEVVGAEAGRVAALLAGDLPISLAEHAEEAGTELTPSEFDASCTCDAWVQPCPHALAVLAQVSWLLDADPLILFALRGLPREDLLAGLADLAEPAASGDDDLKVAEEAALWAADLLDEGSP